MSSVLTKDSWSPEELTQSLDSSLRNAVLTTASFYTTICLFLASTRAIYEKKLLRFMKECPAVAARQKSEDFVSNKGKDAEQGNSCNSVLHVPGLLQSILISAFGIASE